MSLLPLVARDSRCTENLPLNVVLRIPNGTVVTEWFPNMVVAVTSCANQLHTRGATIQWRTKTYWLMNFVLKHTRNPSMLGISSMLPSLKEVKHLDIVFNPYCRMS